ncbi:MAG: hypothetical protein QG657_3342 [Acidobacteriota bacterium]|nr:hypothetical protein [Acidobacteriota bacterium]
MEVGKVGHQKIKNFFLDIAFAICYDFVFNGRTNEC